MAVLDRRALLAGTGTAAITALAGVRISHAEETPGVTATEIKIGSTTSLSGPVSALGVQARCQEAYFRMLNEAGGIAGHLIKYIYYDDAFNPAKTVEQARRLIEGDNVAFLFNMLGTAPNSSVVKYINAAKVPHLFLSVNGDKWGDYESYPWTMGFAPSARIEAQVFAKYALSQNPNAKFAVLFQNDDLGKDFVHGLRDVLGARFETQAAAVSHEVTDPTIDSQMVSLRAGNADVLISGTTAKFAAQSIRKIFELGWKPMHFVTSGAASISSTINPVGPEKAQGVITSAYLKDASDPAWAD
ncbi:MAG TPA: ABC transporter substrate-binding protein, partial [Bradyrhizobium sp.]